MKLSTVALLTLVFVGACVTSAALAILCDPARKRQCPYGHRGLSTVALVYPTRSHPLSENDRARIAKHEAFLSAYSDVNPGSLPKATVYCKRCGFVLLARWTREADEPSGFTQPFSTLLRTFPLPADGQRTYSKYTQDLHHAIVVSERLDFKTTAPLSVLKTTVREWAMSNGLLLEPPRLPDVKPYRLYEGGRLLTEQVQSWGYSEPGPHVTGHVELVDYIEEGIVFVDLLITVPPSAEQSIDDLWKKSRTSR
jgi:hypothetical protein